MGIRGVQWRGVRNHYGGDEGGRLGLEWRAESGLVLVGGEAGAGDTSARRRRDGSPVSLSPEGGLLRLSRWLGDEDAFGVEFLLVAGPDAPEGRELADGDALCLEDGVREGRCACADG